MELTNKVVFITGAARGIGAACAKMLLRKGAKVIIGDVDSTNGPTLADSLNKEFGADKAVFVKCDVSEESSFKDAFQTALTINKQIDVMVNNTGIGDEINWNKTVDVNLKGTIIGTELALAHMRKDRGGQGGIIINVASVVGYTPCFFVPVYAATKHGIIGYTRSMASAPDLSLQGVRYACLAPGATDTPAFEDFPSKCREGYYTKELDDHLQQKTTTEHVAEGLLSLIADSDSNDAIAEVTLDNGIVRKKIIVTDV